MDGGLLDAAWNGDVVRLRQLVTENRGILHNAALAPGQRQTPLHVSCLAGHLPFVLALMNLGPDFTRDVNPDGFTPLHIASSLGHVEIARVLLEKDPTLCLVQGVDNNKIPLHCAVIKGRRDIVQELITANTDSIGRLTARGETVLHLAVNNNQFGVFQDLVEHLNPLQKEHVFNTKDDHGNTILHLAVSRKAYQVIELVLEQVIAVGTMDLNSSNNIGLTPLDILQLYQSEAGDRELEYILRRAGARTSQDLLSPTPTIANTPNRQPDGQPTTLVRRIVKYFMYSELGDSPGHHINFLLIIATLVVTATYQAALNPPGGVWQDDKKGVLVAPGQVPHDAGKAVLGTKNPTGFKIYVFFNSLGFYISMSLIFVLTSKFPMRAELLIAMFALCFTYGSSLGAISPDALPDQISHHLWVATIVVILPIIMVHWYRLNNNRAA